MKKFSSNSSSSTRGRRSSSNGDDGGASIAYTTTNELNDKDNTTSIPNEIPTVNSRQLALLGEEVSNAKPWQATDIQGRPFASRSKIQPPSHGGRTAARGFP